MTNFLAAFLGNGVVLKAPTADGTAGQAVVTDGAKVLSFAGPFAPLTGAGTSGTWGISISGTAATATTALDAALLDGLDSTAFALASHVHSAVDITSGTLPLARGGTNATTAAGSRVSLLPAMAGNALKVLRVNAGETDAEWSAASSGDVVGPASCGDSNFAMFNGSTGKLIADSETSSASFALVNHQHSTSQITSGTLESPRGGTGLASFAVGDILYADTTTSLARRAVGAAGTVLVGGTTPTWSAAPAFTSLTCPTLYGGAAANNDVTIEGTSHATKTTSYVILQPTGGNVGIGIAEPTVTFQTAGKVKIGDASAQIVGGTAGQLDVVGGSPANLLRLIDDNVPDAARVVVERTGNVGFGITLPLATLHTVSGSTTNKCIIVQGAASRTVALLQLQTSAGASLGNVGGSIFDHFGDGASVSVDGTEDTLLTNTTAANTLGINGDSIEGGLTITIVAHAASTDRIQGYFAGIGIFDSTALTYAAAGTVKIRWQIIRVTSTTCRAVVEFFPAGSSAILAFATVKYTSNATLTGLNLATTNIIKWTGIAAGVGAAAGDITARIEKIKWASQAAA